MPATDPLSLVFIGCAVFSGAFLVISSLLGIGGSHFIHLGGHAGSHDFHLGHADMSSAGHAAHVAPTAHVAHAADAHALAAAHANGHVSAHADAASVQTVAAPSLWTSISNTLLGSLNLYGLLMFLLIFGLVGYLAHAVLGWGVLFVILIALILGGISAIGLTALVHVLFATSKDAILTTDDARLEGRLGNVTMTIRPGGIGEVIFTRKGGGRQSVGARSADGEAIPAGAEVVILEYQDGIASVQSWESFLAAARAGVMPELAPIARESAPLPTSEQPTEG